MARPLDDHLKPGELDALVEGCDRQGSAIPPRTLEELTAHVEDCRACAETLNDHRRVAESLLSLAGRSPLERGTSGSCPPPDVWTSLVRGRIPEAEVERLLDHAIECALCSARLSGAAEEDAMIASEREFIDSLGSSGSGWPRDLAGRLRRMGRRRHSPWLVPLAAAAAIFCAVAVGWILWRPANAETLLARAYTASRPMEFRLPDAGYRAVAQSKGSSGTSFSQAPELRKAIGLIDEALRREGEKPELLRQKARAELLELSNADALATLERLHQDSPDDERNWLPLACAYYLRAESQPGAGHEDYARALDLLAGIVHKNPRDPLALFNLALVEERIPNPDAAIRAWDDYLKVDSTSGYAQEALRRRQELRDKKQARDRVLGAVGEAAGRFIELIEEKVPVLAELFLDTALTRWLPRAGTDPVSHRAVTMLSDLLREQTGDTFLQHTLRAPLPKEAVDGLSSAIALDRSADPENGQARAAEAAAVFAAKHNPAGELRALTEHVYGLHRSARAMPCLQAARSLEQRLAGTGYHWMMAQNLIEKSVCLAYLGDRQAAMETAGQAAQRARAARLTALELRAQGMLSSYLLQIGNVTAPWRYAPDSLERYWSAALPRNLGHQFYSDLSEAADRLGLPNASQDYRSAAVDAISATGEALLEAVGRSRLSLAARSAGNPAEAEAEERRSRALFARVPESQLKRDYRLNASLSQAAQQTREGRPEAALPALRELLAAPIPTDVARVRILETLSLALWRTGRIAEARDNALKAVQRNWEVAASLSSAANRMMAASRQAEAYRLLAEIQLSVENDPYAAFLSWQAYRALQSSRSPAMFAPAKGREAEARVLEWGRRLREETLLSLAELPGGPVIWALDDQGLSHARLRVDAVSMRARADVLLRKCADPASNAAQLERSAHAMYQEVFGPVGARLRAGRTVVLDADSLLARMPFALLFGAEGRAIVRSGGLAEYLERAGPSSIRLAESHLLLAYSPLVLPEMARLYPALPDAAREADDVAKYFSRVTRLTGKAATPAALSRWFAAADVFHFSGHGSSDSGNGALVLSAEDGSRPFSGFLMASHMRQQDGRRCQLAVLSACGTAAGERDGPVNPDSLVRSILNAGARRVVAAQWNVDAAATRRLMASFYQQMSYGSPAAKALQEAAAQIRAQPAASHPYYWAAFQVFGYH